MMTMTSPAPQKDAEAFRTISEVAEALKLPQHVLRFWETRFTQIKPLKRAGGRRFYRPQDVELVAAIRQLLYGEGYTIRGVQRILREQGPRGLAALARRREDVGAPALPPAEVAPGEAAGPPPPDDAYKGGAPLALLREALAELAACRAIVTGAMRA